MYPLCRREHKTLGRSPRTKSPMVPQSYSYREVIGGLILFRLVGSLT